MSNQLITLPLPFGTAHVLPQNFSTYQAEIEKSHGKKAKVLAKYLTSKRAEKRSYPNTADDLQSTAAYVRAYFRLNRHRLTGPNEYALNENPTTWPEGPDCIVEECEG